MTASPNGSDWEALLRALAESQARTDERFAEMAAAQARVDEQFARLAAAQTRADERVAALAHSVERLTERVGEISGWAWEWRYRLHAPAYFSRILRRVQVLAPERLVPILDDAVAAGRLSENEADEIERTDLICRGRRVDNDQPSYLVVEVSAGVGPSDVERAARRAALMAKTGLPALAAVAGLRLTLKARETAKQLGVWQVTDGTAIEPSRSE